MKTAYYKYRPLYQESNDGRKPHPFTQTIFEKAEIYYSTPNDFNDPYDCNLKLHVADSTDAEWAEYCDKLATQHPHRKAQMEDVKTRKLWQTEPALSEEVGNETHKTNCESSVFCLSKKPNSIPMFSYYADNHRGIAIEFQFSNEEVPSGIPIGAPAHPENLHGIEIIFEDVKYTSTFPELNYHRLYGKHQLVTNLIFTKHHEWSHEKEMRVFRFGVPASKVRFDKNALTRVIFGCKSTQDDVDLVRSWIIDWPSDVIFAKVEMATSQFALEVKNFGSVKSNVKP